MKPIARFGGTIHDRIECPEMGTLFDVTVLGPAPSDPDDTVSLTAAGTGINVSLHFTRAHARRLGELLIASADDVGEVKS